MDRLNRWVVRAAAILILFASTADAPADEALGYYLLSDANFDGRHTSADIICLVNFMFRGGPQPLPVMMAGDANCDGRIDSADLIDLVNWHFKGQWQECIYFGFYFEYYLDFTGRAEAERLALWLSADLTPPAPLTDRVQEDLQIIRSTYGSEHTWTTGAAFRLPWETGRVVVQADSVTYQAILSGTYDAWDSLNLEYSEPTVRDLGLSAFLLLEFAAFTNPEVLRAAYCTLPGLLTCEVDRRGGDSPNVYTREYGDTLKYLFKFAWGDCPAGCWARRYTMVQVYNSTIDVIGSWNPRTDPEPPWWPAAVEVLDYYPDGPYIPGL